MAEFMKMMAQVMGQQTAILSALVPGAGPGALPGAEVVYDESQHVKDDEAPLEDAEPTKEEITAALEAANLQAVQSEARAAYRAASRRV